VIDFGEKLLVVKSDPITFATDEIGWYAVQVNANDIATTGAEPRWLLTTLLLPMGPPGTGRADRPAGLQAAGRRCVGGWRAGGSHGLERPI
jgi:hypothetical protein